LIFTTSQARANFAMTVMAASYKLKYLIYLKWAGIEAFWRSQQDKFPKVPHQFRVSTKRSRAKICNPSQNLNFLWPRSYNEGRKVLYLLVFRGAQGIIWPTQYTD